MRQGKCSAVLVWLLGVPECRDQPNTRQGGCGLTDFSFLWQAEQKNGPVTRPAFRMKPSPGRSAPQRFRVPSTEHAGASVARPHLSTPAVHNTPLGNKRKRELMLSRHRYSVRILTVGWFSTKIPR